MTDFLHRRLAYHLDGTQGFFQITVPGAPLRDLSKPGMAALNAVADGEAGSMGDWHDGAFLFRFPVPMRIHGIFHRYRRGLRYQGPIPTRIFTSRVRSLDLSHQEESSEFPGGSWISDGTLPAPFVPLDLTGPTSAPGNDLRVGPPGYPEEAETPDYLRWITQEGGNVSTQDGTFNHVRYHPPIRGEYRKVWDGTDGVHPLNLRRVTALRLTLGTWGPGGAWLDWDGYLSSQDSAFYVPEVANILIFGSPEPQTYSRVLEIQDGAHHESARADTLAWGAFPPASSDERTVKIKNLSPSHVAREIRLHFDNTERRPGTFLFSWDRESWIEELVIPEMRPRTTTPVIHIRRVTPSNEPGGSGAELMLADVGRWERA